MMGEFNKTLANHALRSYWSPFLPLAVSNMLAKVEHIWPINNGQWLRPILSHSVHIVEEKFLPLFESKYG